MHKNINGNNVEIMDFSMQYLSSVCDLANCCFGEGYFDEKRYRQLQQEQHIFSVALCDEKLVGFTIVIHESAEQTARHLKLDVCQVQRYANRDGYVCHAKSIAVSPEFRGGDVSDKLVADVTEKSRKAGMSSVWVAAWQFNQKIPAAALLERNGFEALTVKRLLWFDDKQYKCIVCGGVCRCDGVIYYKKI